MAIKALYPRKQNLPHIGEAAVSFLTINSIIWAGENETKPPYDFLASYLEKFGKTTDDKPLNASKLTKQQLDDIALALNEAIQDRISSPDELTSITNAEDFKTYVIEKAVEAEKRSSEVMKDIFSKTSMGRLRNIIGTTQSPSQRLIASIDPLGIKALQRSLNPQWMESMRSAMSLTQSVQDSLKLMPDFSELGASLAIANNLALPGAQIALLSEQITKQFRVSDLQIGAVMDAHRVGRFSENYLKGSLELPGFNATARAGLVGLASKSASAEILVRYAGQELSQTAPLGVAMRAIKELDIIEPEDFEALTELADTATQSMSEVKQAHKYNIIQVLTLIVAVLTLYIAIIDDTGETQKEILKEVTALHEILVNEFDADHETYKYDRILTGTFHLREGNSTKTPSIMLLNKGRIVRQKRIKDGWAYVEVLPYGNEKNVYGWVYRGGLSKLP